ncbi:marine proteobacterial sortase target protein [Labrys wisconsinensis]|uniref:Ca-activated chloride channel family protein n=1 Tax=Labrys wisconsinensis TaxID=425677 RepID=A0ABU0J9L9_9HYPH|nr:marine proteobacterial sortase target protein [Labrys wisconsinensis]MDQ0470964.1 Ca-activated chloride channel family protein [Labrys wisconsinensis]
MSTPVLLAAPPRHPPSPRAVSHRAARAALRRAVLAAAEIAAFATLFIFVTLLACAAAARAEGRAIEVAPQFVSPDDMKSGSLLLQGTQEGRFVEAPKLGTDVDLTVSGPTIRARLTQIFHNPTKGWVEGVYVYPLPEGAAVDTLKMVIGRRVVVADVRKREEAKRIYEDAKAAGQKAALIEQERPNIFTNSVANIGPGETVVVQIEYQEPVHQAGDVFSLRVPLVVAPRYNPGPAIVQSADFSKEGGGWGTTVSDPVPDRARIEPPVLDPRKAGPINPVSISVKLQAGFPLGEVKSSFHQVKIDAPAPDTRVVALDGGMVPADRDFELTWQAAATGAPAVGLFREHLGQNDYLLAYVTPPPGVQAETEQRPREVTFVIDNSGSMGGQSMIQAKASLAYGLGRLKPADRFNVIRFDDTMTALFPDTVPADAEHLAQAQSFVSSIEANGGTEMVPPMQTALTDPRPGDTGFLRQVVFLTDGEIGNEQQLFDTISAGRGRSRVFMVGIGSAPNTYLMTRAAELGRGTYTAIGSIDQVQDHMRALFDKLESPVVTNLTATLSAGGADMTPSALPDLYRGEPLVLAARLGKPAGTLEIRGMIGSRPWVVTLPVDKAAPGKGLSKLWARRKIADAEVAQTLRQITPDEADKRILALALEHHLVTRLTSLVAVDRTPSRPEAERLTRADLPLNLPAGWDFDKVFGRDGEAAPRPEPIPGQRRADVDDPVRLADASAGIAVAVKPVQIGQGTRSAQVRLPQTATDAELRLAAGLALLALSLGLLLAGRRRAVA